MTKLGPYHVHPIADEFPLLSGDEFDQLVADIHANGLIDPIMVTADEKTLVDGRNRWRACKAANVEPKIKALPTRFTESDIIAFVISKNLYRRHLSTGQLAMLALPIQKALAAEAKDRQREAGKTKLQATVPEAKGQARDQAAKVVGVSGKSVDAARRIADADPIVAKEVKAGVITLQEGVKLVAKKPNPAKPPPENAPTIQLRTHDGQVVEYAKPSGKAKFNETNEQVSWSRFTWNPVTGCLHGCRYCYARELANRESYKHAYPVGFTPLFHPERLDAPASTPVPPEAEIDEKSRRVFVCSMADLYGQWVPQEWIDRVHAAAIANPQWDYLLLTKFPRRYVGLDLPPTAWLGTSVDEQKRVRFAEEAFRQIKGVRVKWLSLEPLLAPLQFTDLSMFDWIVIGSQSATVQPDGRVAEFAPPFEWVARLVAQAREAGCRVYLKPNLLGKVEPQSPGMDIPQEEPAMRARLHLAPAAE